MAFSRRKISSIDPGTRFVYPISIPGPAADGRGGVKGVWEHNRMNNTLKVALAMTFMVASILAAVLIMKTGPKSKPTILTTQQYDAMVATAALGGVLLLVAISRYLWKRSKFAHWMTATGKIVDIRDYGSGKSRRLRPIVVFHDSSGKKIEFMGLFGSRSNVVGSEVPVRYDPAGSGRATIDRDFDLYSREYLLLMASSGMLLLGLMLVLCSTHP